MSGKPGLTVDVVKGLLGQPFFPKLLATQGLGTAASDLGVSERSLRRRLTDLGAKPREIIARYRRETLVSMLLEDCPCGAISRELGFVSPCTLSRFAGKQFGHSPRLLRQLLKTCVQVEGFVPPKWTAVRF
jgi:AraC-like DNA-binding protein